MITSILSAVIIFAILIIVHETGHFLMAKKFHMKVTQYFVGFGQTLWSRRRGETEYGVKALPFGGFVKITGMTALEEVDPADEPRTYRQSTYGKKLSVVLAGITVNLIIFVVLVFMVLTFNGLPKNGTTFSSVDKGTPAAAAGIRDGDQIVAIDGKPVKSFNELVSALDAHEFGDRVTLTLRRGQESRDVTLTLSGDSRGEL
ncbi:MAG: M50 family metallopeptidase [Gemmatimonadaceae bacterium]